MNELFVRYNGEIYPCCRVWNYEYLKIGNIGDSPDQLSHKLHNLRHHHCRCKQYRLRGAFPHEEPHITYLQCGIVARLPGKLCDVLRRLSRLERSVQ